LPLSVVFCQSEMPFEDLQVFAAYIFFHDILPSRAARSSW